MKKIFTLIALCGLLARSSAASQHVEVYADADAVARAAAETFVNVAKEASAQGRIARVALSGGSTPKKLFALLGGEYRTRVDWKHVEVFFSDERAVAPTHADSNFGAALNLWLSKVPIPFTQVHRMAADSADLDVAAKDYADTIVTRLGVQGTPRFDLVWLGIGTDGHTASLFPGATALKSRRLVIATQTSDGKARMSFTPKLIAHAERVQFLVTGADKAEILAKIRDPRVREKLPAKLVASRSRGQVKWLLDPPAAALLPARSRR